MGKCSMAAQESGREILHPGVVRHHQQGRRASTFPGHDFHDFVRTRSVEVGDQPQAVRRGAGRFERELGGGSCPRCRGNERRRRSEPLFPQVAAHAGRILETARRERPVVIPEPGMVPGGLGVAQEEQPQHQGAPYASATEFAPARIREYTAGSTLPPVMTTKTSRSSNRSGLVSSAPIPERPGGLRLQVGLGEERSHSSRDLCLGPLPRCPGSRRAESSSYSRRAGEAGLRRRARALRRRGSRVPPRRSDSAASFASSGSAPTTGTSGSPPERRAR